MEHLIDIFARDPNSLSETDRDRIDALLAEHPVFRDYLDHLRDFYRSFRESSAEAVPDHVRAFADSLVRLPRRLLLRAPRTRNSGTDRGSGYFFLRADAPLAADLSESAGGMLRPAGSRVSTDYGVLLRFIEDRSARELRGYVLSPNQAEASLAVIRFERMQDPVPADSAGVVRIPLTATVSADDLLAGRVEMMLPVASVTVRPTDLQADTYTILAEVGDVRIEARAADTGVRIRVSETSESNFLVIARETGPVLHRLDRPEFHLKSGDLTTDLSLRLYAE